MLSKIRIKNFKCLRDTGIFEFKPLTILIGPNSSGKSSLIQFLLMIKQTAENRHFENPLIFNEDCIKLESYKNIIWKNDIELPLEFEFCFEPTDPKYNAFFPPSNMYYHVNFYSKKGRLASIDSFKIVHKENEKIIMYIKWGKDLRKPTIKECIFSDDIKKFLSERLAFIKFYPIFLTDIRRKLEKYDKSIVNAIKTIPYFDHYFSRHIFYLAPLREFLKRFYEISGAVLEDVGFKGERSVEVIIKKKDIANNVCKWIKKLEIAKDVKFKTMRKKTLAEVILTHQTLGFDINLYDLGFGASQILPIIAEGFYAPKESIILIEQPEIHLHPKLQADMGDLLIEIAKLEKKLVIETHSEHLLLRIQRRIAEGKLDIKDVAIYYFNLTSTGTKITKIRIDKTGRIENWPKGFFEEDIKETIAITKAYMKKSKEDAS